MTMNNQKTSNLCEKGGGNRHRPSAIGFGSSTQKGLGLKRKKPAFFQFSLGILIIENSERCCLSNYCSPLALFMVENNFQRSP